MNRSFSYSLLALLSLYGSVLMAETLFVTQSGAGLRDGSSLGNAWAVSDFNTAGNWGAGAGKIGSGDTVLLNGTLTTALTVQGSGTNGNPITLLFAAGAKLSAAAWASSGAIVIFQKDYITIDGGTNGLIENTANGTGLANQVDSYGVKATSCKSLTVQNLAVNNLYIRIGPSQTDTNQYGHCISNLDSNGRGLTDFTVTNCTMHDAFVGIDSDYGAAASNYTFTGNTAYNCNWGGRCGDRGATSTLSGLVVANNAFYNWSNWDSTGSVDIGLHHNGFYAWAESGGTLTNPVFYANTIGPGWGGQYQTAGIFISCASGTVVGARVYNNVFVCAASEYAANGFVTIGGAGVSGTFYIANNTFYSGGIGNTISISGGSAPNTYTVKNNIGYGAGGGTFLSVGTNANVTMASDTNDLYNYSSSTFNWSPNGSSVFKTFVQWKALGAGFDPSSITTDPLLTATYRLSSGSPAVGTGTDLSSIFTTDITGLTRYAPWDIGAYKWTGGGSVGGGKLTLGGGASIK